MTKTEIKKAYQAAKKAYEKRTGDKYTWVMNAKQQQLGTATIYTAYVCDYSCLLNNALQSLANFEKDWAEKMADYNKRARVEARKNELTPGWYFGRNDTFWEDIVNDTEKLEADKADELKHRQDRALEYKEHLDNGETYSKLLHDAIDETKAMIASPELQSFLEKIGVDGKALVITKEVDETIVKSARNIPGVVTTIATILAPYEIMKARTLVVDKAALAKIEEVYC